MPCTTVLALEPLPCPPLSAFALRLHHDLELHHEGASLSRMRQAVLSSLCVAKGAQIFPALSLCPRLRYVGEWRTPPVSPTGCNGGSFVHASTQLRRSSDSPPPIAARARQLAIATLPGNRGAPKPPCPRGLSPPFHTHWSCCTGCWTSHRLCAGRGHHLRACPSQAPRGKFSWLVLPLCGG